MNWLLSLMLVGSLSSNAIASTSPENRLEECDSVLGECTLVVEAQNKAIIAQVEVIGKQEEVIEAKNNEIQIHKSGKGTATGIAIVEGVLLLLLIL